MACKKAAGMGPPSRQGRGKGDMKKAIDDFAFYD